MYGVNLNSYAAVFKNLNAKNLIWNITEIVEINNILVVFYYKKVMCLVV